MIETISVLDLKRGDTVIIVPGNGRHRGLPAADSGIIEVSSATVNGVRRFRGVPGVHAARDSRHPRAAFMGYGDDWLQEERFEVPSDTMVTVMR